MDRRSCTICLFLCVVSLSHIPSILARDSLAVGEKLATGQVLVSSKGTFTLGFFRRGNNSISKRNHYLGLWYSSIPDTILWVANRDQPLLDSDAFLTVTDEGNLAMRSENKSSAWWSTGVTSPSNGTAAMLQETGNLVLKSASGVSLWESFDYPTGSLLDDMRIRINFSTGESEKLVAWKSDDDPSGGDIFFQVKLFSMYLFNGTGIIWRSNVWSGKDEGWKNKNAVDDVQFNVQSQLGPTGLSIGVSANNGSLPARLSLYQTGTLKMLYWQKSRNIWQPFRTIPDIFCERYGQCGAWAACDDHQNPATCTCLEGFTPKNKVEWDGGIFTSGCVRRIPLQKNIGDQFFLVENMKVPDNFSAVSKNNEVACQAECISTVECTAYMYRNLIADSLAPRCLTWRGDLFDVQTLKDGDEQNIYIRLSANEVGVAARPSEAAMAPGGAARSSEAAMAPGRSWRSSEATMAPGDNHQSNKILSPSLIFVAGLVLIVAIVIVMMWLRSRGRTKATKLEDIKFSDSSLMGGAYSDAPMVDLKSIESATSGFSEEKKLGEGGFGSVYKGSLPNGHEFAVKRLSKGSKQGQLEFANEVRLIAKLQHKNLVRLLGWCNEKKEMILIYEYMPQKSLDQIIFGRPATLTWEKKIEIIRGVSDGLLYLHRHSRTRIIHRDLKTSNILLDNAMNPKISDFGLAKIVEINQARGNTGKIAGTFGYMAPEYALNGVFSEKSDVFSFGVILLEIITGKRSTGYFSDKDSPSLLENVWSLWCEGRAMEFLSPTMMDSVSVAQALRCIQIGLLCVQENAEDRPTMNSIISMLNVEKYKLRHPKRPGFFQDGESRCSNERSLTCSTKRWTQSMVEPR